LTALLAFGAFSSLLALQVIVIPVAWLAVIAAVSVVWLLPGLLLWSAFLRRHALGLDALPLFLALGPGLITLLSALVLLGRATIDVAIYIVIVLNLAILISCALVLWRYPAKVRRTAAALRAKEPGINYALLGLFLISLLVLVFAFTTNATVVKVGDRWTYLGLVRNHLDAPRLATSSPFLKGIPVIWRQALDSWGLQLAMLSRIAQVNPVDLYSSYLPPLLITASALAYISLAVELFKNRNLALFAFLLQVIYLLSASQSDEGMGFHFFARIVEDKFAALFVLYPLAILFMLRYVSSGRLRPLLGFGLSVVASGLIHPIGPVHCALATGGFALAHLPFNWHREKAIRFLILLLVILAAMLPPFFQRAQVSKFSLTSPAFTEQSLARAMSDYGDRLLILDLDQDIYMAHPHLIEHPLVILALLLTPLLLLDIRESIAAQFLFSNMFVVVVLLYNPITAPLLGRLITPWMVERLTWILPTTLTTALFIYKALTWVYSWLTKARPVEPSLRWGLFLLAPLALAIALLWGRLAGSWDYLQWWYSREVSSEERALMSYMREHVRANSVILARPEMGNHIPGLMGKAYPIAYRTLEDSPASAYDDIQRFYAKNQVDAHMLGFLERYSVDYVVLEADTPLAFQFSQFPAMFFQLYSSDEYELYAVTSEVQPDNVVLGNTHLSLGDWDAASEAYERALDEHADEDLAYWGLVKAYKAQGRTREMIAAAQQLVSLAPRTDLTLDYLAQELDIEPSFLLRYLAEQETFQTPVGTHVAHDLLEHLDQASLLPPGNRAFIRRSAFVIDGTPKGVIFQHAPSSVTYRLTVPENANLSFALALAPEVWSFGKGDGTQFDVKLQDAEGTSYRLFSEYIDPKNILDHRCWHLREIDLSMWAGQTVDLTFITHPGPNDDSRYDWAGWAEPRIIQPGGRTNSPSFTQ
jgi:tetratricopeptide (TPR) repeat protein